MRQYSPPKKERKKGKKGFSVHCGSAVAPGASRSLHCCSPLVCVLNLSGGLAVWWLYKQTNKLPTFPPFSWICTAKQTNSPFSKRWDSKRSPQKKSKLWMVNVLFPCKWALLKRDKWWLFWILISIPRMLLLPIACFCAPDPRTFTTASETMQN